MVAWRTLALAIIPLVALFLVASWMMGGIDEIKDTVKFYLPEVKVGADKLTAEKLYEDLALFVNRVDNWRRAIDSGQTYPSNTTDMPAVAQNKRPNVFGF